VCSSDLGIHRRHSSASGAQSQPLIRAARVGILCYHAQGGNLVADMPLYSASKIEGAGMNLTKVKYLSFLGVYASWLTLFLMESKGTAFQLSFHALVIWVGYFLGLVAAWSHLKLENRSFVWMILALLPALNVFFLPLLILCIKRRQTAQHSAKPVGFFGELFDQCPDCRAWFALKIESAEELDRESAYTTVTRRDQHFDRQYNKIGETRRREQIRVVKSTLHVTYKCQYCNSDFEGTRVVTTN
jgi:ribosomal protein L44E